MAKKVFVFFKQKRRKGNGNGSDSKSVPLAQWPVVCASLCRDGFIVLSSQEMVGGFPSTLAIGVELGTPQIQQVKPLFAKIQRDFKLPAFRQAPTPLFEQ